MIQIFSPTEMFFVYLALFGGACVALVAMCIIASLIVSALTPLVPVIRRIFRSKN